MLNRLLIAALVVLFLVGLFSAVWNICDWPPPRLILKHGFPPTGGPTGRTMTIEGVEFVELKPGYFRMGSHFQCEEGDLLGRVCAVLHLPWGRRPKHDGNECPQHWVEVAKGFWIARTEVTNAQYEQFHPEHQRSESSKGNDDPVAEVSWEDAQAYCRWLATRSGLTVRLPSEAEWESACRAGSMGDYCFGDDPARLGEYAWFGPNSDNRAHAVKTKRPNAWGLFDLHGNVWEWCEDVWHEDYREAPEDASAWKQGASPLRVFRGVGFNLPAAACRSAFRFWRHPSYSDRALGFRPVVGGH